MTAADVTVVSHRNFLKSCECDIWGFFALPTAAISYELNLNEFHALANECQVVRDVTIIVDWGLITKDLYTVERGRRKNKEAAVSLSAMSWPSVLMFQRCGRADRSAHQSKTHAITEINISTNVHLFGPLMDLCRR